MSATLSLRCVLCGACVRCVKCVKCAKCVKVQAESGVRTDDAVVAVWQSVAECGSVIAW